MAKRKHTAEEIINKLREAEVVIAAGSTVAEATRRIGVSEQTFYRWRAEYGGLRVDQARRLKQPRETSEPRPPPPLRRSRQVNVGCIGAEGRQDVGTATLDPSP